MQLLMLAAYLVNGLTFGDIHSFGIGISENLCCFNKLLALAVPSCEQTHRGSWTADFEGSCAGTDVVTRCAFMHICNPKRNFHGLLKLVKKVQAFLYIFKMGVGLDLHWQYPGPESAAVCSQGMILFLFSPGPHSFHYTIATGRIRAQFPSCPISYLYFNISWRPLSRARPCCTWCFVYP